MNRNITIVFLSSKGGPGKSTLAGHVAPLLCSCDVINVHELDNHNKTMFTKSKKVKFKTLEVKYANSVINEIDFSNLTQADTSVCNIIDIGGGSDTMVVLSSLKKSGLSGLTYVIPVNDDVEQVTNLFDTIYAIKDTDQEAKIYTILNRVHSMDPESIKSQYINIFGSKIYGIKSHLNELQKETKSINFVRNTPLYGILKNIHSRTLLDGYIEAKTIVNDIENLKLKWAKGGIEVFEKNMEKYHFAQDIIALAEELKPLSIIFKKEK